MQQVHDRHHGLDIRFFVGTNEEDQLLKMVSNHEKELSKIKKSQEKLLDKVEADAISVDDLKARMDKYKDREAILTSEIQKAEGRIKAIPKQNEIAKGSQLMQRMILSRLKSPEYIEKMSFEEKREIIQAFFSGYGPDGRRLGVYIKRDENEQFSYEIYGRFLDKSGTESFKTNDDILYNYKQELSGSSLQTTYPFRQLKKGHRFIKACTKEPNSIIKTNN